MEFFPKEPTLINIQDRHNRRKEHVAPLQTNVISHSGRIDHVLRVDKATPLPG